MFPNDEVRHLLAVDILAEEPNFTLHLARRSMSPVFCKFAQSGKAPQYRHGVPLPLHLRIRRPLYRRSDASLGASEPGQSVLLSGFWMLTIQTICQLSKKLFKTDRVVRWQPLVVSPVWQHETLGVTRLLNGGGSSVPQR